MKKELTNSRCEKTLNIGGEPIKMVTVMGLAQIVGKSRRTIQRYEEVGIFPPAPIIYKDRRYYSLALAHKLRPLVMLIPGNKKPPAELLTEINKLFNEERNYYASKENR